MHLAIPERLERRKKKESTSSFPSDWFIINCRIPRLRYCSFGIRRVRELERNFQKLTNPSLRARVRAWESRSD